MATVGYGDVTARTDPSTALFDFRDVHRGRAFGYVIGDIATLVANSIWRGRTSAAGTVLNGFMNAPAFSAALMAKVNSFYHYIWTTRTGGSHEDAFAELPESLRTEISLHLNRRVLEKVPLFHNAG